jgi:hypothetical protein
MIEHTGMESSVQCDMGTAQALFPGELLDFESKLDGDFFLDRMSPRSGDERSCRNGTNIGFVCVFEGLLRGARWGCGD